MYTTRRIGKLRTINANFQLGNNRPFSMMVFRKERFFTLLKREKLLTPFKFHPSWNRNFCHPPSRWNYVSTLRNISSFFPGQGERIGGKFKYSRQIQNPSSLTRVTLGKRSPIKILETGHWYYSIVPSFARCCTCESR